MTETILVWGIIFAYWLIDKAINTYENIQLAKYECGCTAEEGEESNASTSAS